MDSGSTPFIFIDGMGEVYDSGMFITALTNGDSFKNRTRFSPWSLQLLLSQLCIVAMPPRLRR